MTLQFDCLSEYCLSNHFSDSSTVFFAHVCTYNSNRLCVFKTDSAGQAQGQTEKSRKNVTHFLLGARHPEKHANHPSLLPKLWETSAEQTELWPWLQKQLASLHSRGQRANKRATTNLNVFRLALYQLATGTTVGALTTAGSRSACSFVLNSHTGFHLKKQSSLRENGFGIHWQTIITLSCTCCWSNFTLNFCQAVNFSWAALCNVYCNCLL